MAEADQGFVEAGFVDDVDGFFAFGSVAQVDALGFVGLQAAVQGLGMWQAEHAGYVVADEPGLVVDHHAAQGAVVAGEEGGGVCVVHGEAPTS